MEKWYTGEERLVRRGFVRRSSLSQKEKMPVIVQADKTVTTELLIRVIDEAKLAGALSVNVSTD